MKVILEAPIQVLNTKLVMAVLNILIHNTTAVSLSLLHVFSI